MVCVVLPDSESMSDRARDDPLGIVYGPVKVDVLRVDVVVVGLSRWVEITRHVSGKAQAQ